MCASSAQATDQGHSSAVWRITDWLDLHDVDATAVQDIIAAWRSGSLADRPSFSNAILEAESDGLEPTDRKASYFHLVVSAFSSRFSGHDDIRAALERVSFRSFPDNVTRMPHTIDVGEGKSPVIVMDWHGGPDDLICLAHEAAHALQIMLSNHMMMPPLARETCAFLGELFLIEHSREHSPSLFPQLMQTWRTENESYLAIDLDSLSDALTDPGTPYHYSQNYPVARLAAVELFRRGGSRWLHDLFASGSDGMRHLPIAAMANLAGDIENHLPRMPEADPEHPVADTYRGLGAMALLDIDYWEGESEKQIKDYHANLLEHLWTRTAFVALNDDRRPVGYATWLELPGNGTVTLTRQAAPFGDHLVLQRALERHLDHADGVAAHHVRSAREEQVAW